MADSDLMPRRVAMVLELGNPRIMDSTWTGRRYKGHLTINERGRWLVFFEYRHEMVWKNQPVELVGARPYTTRFRNIILVNGHPTWEQVLPSRMIGVDHVIEFTDRPMFRSKLGELQALIPPLMTCFLEAGWTRDTVTAEFIRYGLTPPELQETQQCPTN